MEFPNLQHEHGHWEPPLQWNDHRWLVETSLLLISITLKPKLVNSLPGLRKLDLYRISTGDDKVDKFLYNNSPVPLLLDEWEIPPVQGFALELDKPDIQHKLIQLVEQKYASFENSNIVFWSIIWKTSPVQTINKHHFIKIKLNLSQHLVGSVSLEKF